MKIYIGTSGWQYYHWKGKFYPENLASKDFLKFYAKHFNTVEINTSFYHFTKKETFEKWKKEIADLRRTNADLRRINADLCRTDSELRRKKLNIDFLFSVKLHRLFTHFRRLKLNKEDKKLLLETIQTYKVLNENLGPILIQLPPGLKYNLKLLKSFINAIKKIKKIKFTIEFRHKTWLNKKVYALLKKYKIAFVISDSPRWPTDYIKTANFVYVRFHGKPKLFASKYSEKELEEYINKIKKLKPKELYIYFNNDFEGYAIENALFVKKLLKKE